MTDIRWMGLPRTWIAAAIAICAGCATLPPPTANSIDFADPESATPEITRTLEHYRGKVVMLDVCTSWVAACNLNAKVLDEAVVAFPDGEVVAVTLLLDEPQLVAPALKAYREDFGVKHPIVVAGARVRAGTSSLKDTGYVPRVVVLDKEGRVRLDEAGGVIGLEGLVDRVRPLVDE